MSDTPTGPAEQPAPQQPATGAAPAGQTSSGPTSGAQASTAQASMPQDPGAEQLPQAEIDSGKVWAILGYIFPIICIVPFIQKDNRFALFHAKQQLVLIIVSVAISILVSVTTIIPFLPCITGPLAMLTMLFFLIMGLVNSINGRMQPLPVIGKFAIDWFKGLQATPKA